MIRLVLDTRDTCLRLKPNLDDEWDLLVYSDNDCEGYVENCISVTDFIIFLLGSQFVEGQRVRKGVPYHR
jgi:hypothetical protein